jgi:hypothetical protein
MLCRYPLFACPPIALCLIGWAFSRKGDQSYAWAALKLVTGESIFMVIFVGIRFPQWFFPLLALAIAGVACFGMITHWRADNDKSG